MYTHAELLPTLRAEAPLTLIMGMVVYVVAALDSQVFAAIIAGVFMLVNSILTIYLTKQRIKQIPENDETNE